MADTSFRARRWAAATGQPQAVAAAEEIIGLGGSAVDAAIAADAVLGVVEPMATGIGGDILAMVVQADGHCVAYNGTGRSPAALDPGLVAALPGARIPERHPLAPTVPGVVQGWADLHGRYGRLEWKRLFARAIAAAEHGFAVAPVAAREWAIFAPVLASDPQAARLYRAEQPPLAGETFANPALAGLLREIAEHGAAAFYQGRAAALIERRLGSLGGVLRAADLAAHEGEFVEPLRTAFRGLEVLECPPNTHGLGVLEALRTLDGQALDEADPAAHLAVVEATREAMAHARKVVADPSGNTVCTVVVDEDGLAVSLMSSIFKRFGSGIAVGELGFVLQNRGFGFAPPGQLNGAAPARRPFHTVIPAATLRHGRFHSAFGVVGGAMQPQGHIQLMVRTAAWGHAPQAAIDAPRWRLEGPHSLAIEEGTPAAVERYLRQAGFEEPRGVGELAGRSDFGGAQWIAREESGELVAGSDRRKDGFATGS